MSKEINIAEIRDGYEREGLLEAELASDPITQFNKWMKEAVDAGFSQPNAFTLATSSKEGRPSARILLLKYVTAEGFVFFTNYNGHKGREMQENPFAAMVFLWPKFSRQVRINGKVEKVNEVTSDEYFAVRPRGSQLGAWASPQSEVVANRQVLEKAMQQRELEFDGVDVPRPPHWGGFCLVPDSVEFWQGRPSRLHDRLRYKKDTEGQWLVQRLAP